MKVIHEYSDLMLGSRHRLVAHYRRGKQIPGQWTTYRLHATLTIKDVTYVAVTDYWEAELPFPVPGKIYAVKEVKTQFIAL